MPLGHPIKSLRDLLSLQPMTLSPIFSAWIFASVLVYCTVNGAFLPENMLLTLCYYHWRAQFNPFIPWNRFCPWRPMFPPKKRLGNFPPLFGGMLYYIDINIDYYIGINTRFRCVQIFLKTLEPCLNCAMFCAYTWKHSETVAICRLVGYFWYCTYT